MPRSLSAFREIVLCDLVSTHSIADSLNSWMRPERFSRRMGHRNQLSYCEAYGASSAARQKLNQAAQPTRRLEKTTLPLMRAARLMVFSISWFLFLDTARRACCSQNARRGPSAASTLLHQWRAPAPAPAASGPQSFLIWATSCYADVRPSSCTWQASRPRPEKILQELSNSPCPKRQQDEQAYWIRLTEPGKTERSMRNETDSPDGTAA